MSDLDAFGWNGSSVTRRSAEPSMLGHIPRAWDRDTSTAWGSVDSLVGDVGVDDFEAVTLPVSLCQTRASTGCFNRLLPDRVRPWTSRTQRRRDRGCEPAFRQP